MLTHEDGMKKDAKQSKSMILGIWLKDQPQGP